jgi:glycosyltransferase involved in cell wall biosynthesis
LPLDTPPDHILYYQLSKFEPDVIYLSDIPFFNFGILDALQKKPLVVGWHASQFPAHVPWKKIDLLLSGITALRARAKELGCKATAKFMSGCPNYRNVMGKVEKKSKGNIAFAGSFFPKMHESRAEFLIELARALPPNSLDIFTTAQISIPGEETPNFQPAVYGADVVRIYSDYKIVIDLRADFGLPGEYFADRETSNMRIFEAVRAGSLLVTERCSNLNEYFSDGKEIETFGSLDEAIDKVQYYLDDKNDESRKRIAQAGYERGVREHTIEARATWLVKIFQANFGL